MINILVVNNDLDTMSLLQTWLEKKSYSVKYTSNADEVPSLIKTFEPHVVLVDEAQREVIGRIKGDGLRHIPVILMTGYAARDATLYMQIDDIIEKPFDPGLLRTLIEKYSTDPDTDENNKRRDITPGAM